jgi:nucleoside-diphosphate-sugar epimerase
MTRPLLQIDLNEILEHSGQTTWERLRSKKIFITGGTGFFGKWLLESWAHANHQLQLESEVLVLARNPDVFLSSMPHLKGIRGLNFVTGDVVNFKHPQFKPDFIIHAATPASAKLNTENPGEMIHNILSGMRNVLDYARASDTKRLLFTSSGAVYGRQPPELTHTPETFLGAPDPLNTGSAYGEAKRMAELLCQIEGRFFALETIVARCYAFVGPHLPLDSHFAVGNFIRDGLAGKTLQIQGDGTPYRSYLYAADLTAWLWYLLTQGQAGTPYHVGSSRALSIRQTAEKVAEIFKLDLNIAKAADATLLPERYVPSNERTLEATGLREWTSFKEALKRTIEWHT